MNRFALLLAMSGALSTLTSCSLFFGDDGFFRDRDKDYLLAEPTTSMSVPEDMHAPNFQPLFPIPNVQAIDEFGDPQNLTEYQVPRPDTVTADELSLIHI